MISLFKKKSEPAKEESMPPLPDDLPDENNSAIPTMNSSSLSSVSDTNEASNNTHNNNSIESTHDLIPNDISLNPLQENSIEKPELSLETDNEPEIEDPTTPELPPLDSMNTTNEPSLPPMPDIKTNEPDLPEIPSLKSKENKNNSTSNPDVNKSESNINSVTEEPHPNIDDDIPEPPAIFSEDGFYETPDEVKHLVKDTTSNLTNYDSELKTSKLDNVNRIEVPRETIDMQNDTVPGYNDNDIDIKLNRDSLMSEVSSSNKTNGPIFVDMDSFKTMIDGIDNIKQDVKSSEQILTHLNQIKDSKDKELERWRLQLEDIQRKISYVDKVIFNEA